jgi:hypothetical protein
LFFEEFLDRKQRFLIQPLDGALMNTSRRKHFAQRGGELINQAGDPQMS